MYQGDPGALMYIMDHGALDVLIHNRAVDGKRRAPGINVATLNKRGDYCGEFTLLVEEPRAASLRAAETTCLWALQKEALRFWISKLPAAAQLEARQVADSRRQANMYKLYPLTPQLVQENAMFRAWARDGCHALIHKCTPKIFTPGEVMIPEGAAGDFMYFLARGDVRVFSQHSMCSEKLLGSVHPPHIVGEVALLFKEVWPFAVHVTV